MNRILNEGYDYNERASKAIGKYIKINNEWLIDTSMGAGTHIFGHGAVLNDVKQQLNKGSLYIVPNKIADECAELLHEITRFDRFVFCNSGSEATLRCIRIARALTGRDKIALFEGCWHGTHDWNLALYSNGIPQAVKDMVVVLPFTEEAIKRINQNDIAMVMIEPVQTSLPINRKEFLNKIRRICTYTNTVLCFDEVISGFRMAMGGAAEYYNIKPDLVSYGKIVGGGLPVGVVGGVKDVMEIIKSNVRMGGTFSANPITMIACKSVLKKLIKKEPHEKLHNVMAGLSKIKTDILQVKVIGGIARLIYTNKSITSIKERDDNELSLEKRQQIIYKLRKSGLYINGNNALLLSTEHTNKDVKIIKEKLEEIKEI